MLSLAFLIVAVADLIVARSFINPSKVSAYLLAFFAFFGAEMWNWSRSKPGAGLPSLIDAVSGESSLAYRSLLGAALGLLLSSLLTATRLSELLKSAKFHFKVNSGSTLILSASLYGLWVAGQGLSLFARDVYLQRDGFEILAKLIGTAAPALGILIFVVATDQFKKRPTSHILLAMVWFVSLLSVGTRLAIGFSIGFVVALIIPIFRSKRLSRLAKGAFGGAALYIGVFFVLETFWITFITRQMPHGIFRIVDLLTAPGGPSLTNPTQWSETVQMGTSSIAASYPIIELSALNHPSLQYILSNANPLPSVVVNTANYAAERVWPYEWVPQAFWGQIYGAVGVWGSVLSGLILGFVANFLMISSLKRGRISLVIFIFLTCLLAVFVGLEYPSRNFFRIVSFIYMAPAVFFIGKKLRLTFSIQGRVSRQSAS